VARYAPQGDVGKHTDAAIAAGVHWDRDCKRFIEALVEARWLERNDAFRLVVHDWHDHADESVKKHLARQGLRFWNGNKPYPGKCDSVAPPPTLTPDSVATGSDSVAPALAPAIAVAIASASAKGGWVPPERSPTTVLELLAALQKTGRFPNLTEAAVAQGVQGWPKSEEHWGKLVVEAESMVDREIGSPVPWISKVLGRYVGLPGGAGQKEKNAGGDTGETSARQVYVPLKDRTERE